MYLLATLPILLASLALAAHPKPCPPTYHLAFSTNQNTSAPIYRAARLLSSSNTTTIYIVAGDLLPPAPTTSGAQAIFNGTGSRQCLSLSSPTVPTAGLSIGTPRLDPSGPAFSYPIIVSPNFAGDCRWNIGTDPAAAFVFPGIYEANEGLYACQTVIGDGLYDVLSLGKIGGGLESPKGCVYSVATAFRAG